MDIIDINKSQLELTYDLVVLSSGYEDRATYAIQQELRRFKGAQVLVIGFCSLADNEARKRNDKIIRDTLGVDPISIDSHDARKLFDILRSLNLTGKIRVFLDYSSMSRTWYSSVLYYFKFSPNFNSCLIDCWYTCASYSKSFDPIVIDRIQATIGCEGISDPGEKLVTFLGLGFDHVGTECLLEQLEPDITIPFYATGGSEKDYDNVVLRNNESILNEITRGPSIHPFAMPLRSVRTTYSMLADLGRGYRNGFNCIIAPMGPKPHVLSSILVSHNFPHIGCLHVLGKQQTPVNATPTGDVVITKVILSKETKGDTVRR